MKIGVFPADLAGCGHYRLIWPAFALQELTDLDITIVPPDKRDGMFTGMIENDEVIDVTVPNFDVMIFQRVTHKYLAQAVTHIRRKGIAVVVDIDDDLEAIHPANPAWKLLHPRNSVNNIVKQHSWHWARVACEAATYVTVSSAALLKRYAHHGRGAIIRNYVPEEYLTIPHESSPIIGWGGSLHSHPNDVPVLKHSIAQLINMGHEFRVIGPGDGIQDALHLSEAPIATGPVDLDGWPIALAQLGVGVAPLAWETRFNAAKSWLKPLEYAAVGVVPVMSPGIEYRAIHKRGIGLIAEKQRDWILRVGRLAREESFREDLALKMRTIIAAEFTVQANAHRWEEAWTTAYQLQERVPPPVAVGSAFGIRA